MTFQEYQEATKKFAQYPRTRALHYLIPGLAAECGEVAGKWAKKVRGDKGILMATLLMECGDVMWFVSQICNELDFNMEDLAKQNIQKLQDRLDRGVIKGFGDHR